MNPPRELPAPVHELAETLAVSLDAGARARLLLEGVLALGAGRSAALWRRVPGEACSAPNAAGANEARAAGWRAILAHGPSETQPPASQVLAVLAGELDTHLPGRHRVIGACSSASVALVLGEACEEEDRIDLAEGLFACWAAADLAPSELLEAMGSLLPGAAAGPDASPGASEPGAGAGPLGDLGLTHDLRNLLAGIRSTQELLDELGEGLGEDERLGFEHTLGRECGRAGELLARIATGLGAPRTAAASREGRTSEPTEPARRSPTAAAIVRDVVRSESARAARAGVRIELHEDPEAADFRVALGELELERVARNLIVNAREAIERADRPRGVVAVTLGPLSTAVPAAASGERAAPRHLRLGVEDDGPGLPQELAQRLLEPGVSGKRPSERGAAPCGLGLASVAALVERAGGRLACGNLPAGGARFELWLPGR